MSVSAVKKLCLSTIEQLSEQKQLEELPHFAEELEYFRRRLEDDEFRIAVVGEFSSGKSTFINAMLGKDLLQHASTETTAALTRLVNVDPADPRCGSGTVRLRNGDILTLPTLNNLKEYTTTASEQFHVVDEIEFVELYLPILKSKHRIVIVDTPGLNGTADGHREQTVRLIQQAHACIYLIQRRGLAESDVEFLTYLTQIQKNFIFVQNFIDDLRTSEGDTLEEKLAEQAGILDRQVFSRVPDADYRICGVSALLALAGRDEDIRTLYADSSEILTPKMRQTLYQKSRFDTFYDLLTQTFQDDRLEEIQYGDTAAALSDWLRSLLEQISRLEAQAKELYQTSGDRRILEKLERLREKTLKSQGRHENQLKNFVLAKGNDMRSHEKQLLHQELLQVARNTEDEIRQFPSLAHLEKWEKKLPDILSQEIGHVLIRQSKRYDQQFQAFYQLLLTRIEEYSGVQCEELDLNILKLSKPQNSPGNFQQEQNELQRLRTEVQKKRDTIDRIERELAIVKTSLRQSQDEVQSLEGAMEQNQANLAARTTELGERPHASTRSEAYTSYEYRGGLGVLDFFLGPKEITRYRQVIDDSEGVAWDQKKAALLNPLIEEERKLEKQLQAAKRSELRQRNAKEDRETEYQKAKQRVEDLEKRVRVKEETLRHKKEYAVQEYLTSYKKHLIEQIERYLFGESGVEVQILQNLNNIIVRMEQEFTEWALDRFRWAMDRKLAWIEVARQKKYPELLRQVQHLTDTKNILFNLKEKMEAQLA